MTSKFYRETVAATTKDPFRRLIEFNCVLKNLTHAYRFFDALRLFQQIHSSHHLRPGQYTVSAALTASANLHNVSVGSQLHAYSIVSGLQIFPHVRNSLLSLYGKSQNLVSVKMAFEEIKKPDIYSYTTLLSALTKLGEVDHARQLFDKIPHQDAPVWNAMITGCAENGYAWFAMDLFHRMHVLGVKADNYAYASVLSICSLSQLDFARQVHGLVVKTGFFVRASVINSLITMYFNCESAISAYELFEEVGCEVGDEVTYNAVMAGLSNMNRQEDALFMFKDMLALDLKPTELTCVIAMGACTFSRTAIQIHCRVVKSGFEDCVSVNNAAISMYSKCGNLNDACLIFTRLKDKDIVSWNAIIACYAQKNMGSDAIFVYLQMQRHCIQPDEFTIGSLLSGSESSAIVEMIQAMVIKTALIARITVSNALLSAFSRFGEMKQANKLFSNMQPKDIISWNAMISGFQSNELPEDGLQHFEGLLQSGLRPNHYTLGLILGISADLSDLHRGKQVHAYSLKLGYSSNLLCNALIALYADCGALSLSLKVFVNMTERDIVSWNSLISAFSKHGEGEEAIHCFKTLQCSGGISPDKATFTAVLSACSRSGLIEDGLRIFNSMVDDYGIEPEPNHFSCIVDLLARAGFIDMTERLIMTSTNMKIDSEVWWTLFSLCVAHGNLELGNIVAGFLLENSEKDDPAVYVLMSNLYANAGKWEESANVRELMKKYGVLKQPGGSWIAA